MPNIDTWLSSGDRDWALAQSRPASVGNLILDKPTTITIDRNGTDLAAQVVRLDSLNAADQQQYGAAYAATSTQKVLLLGYRNHPTVTDTNVREQDTFYVAADDTRYKVLAVEVQFNDRLLAVCEAT